MEKAGVALYHRVLRRENFEKWSDTLKPHTQGDIIKHRKGVADGTEIRRGI